MSVLLTSERWIKLARINVLQEDEAMILDDDLATWWDFDPDGIELCDLREEFGDRYEKI